MSSASFAQVRELGPKRTAVTRSPGGTRRFESSPVDQGASVCELDAKGANSGDKEYATKERLHLPPAICQLTTADFAAASASFNIWSSAGRGNSFPARNTSRIFVVL